MNSQVGASDISRALAERVEALAHALATAPVQRVKGQIRVGNRGSLAIELRHPSPGVWMDHETGQGGDALDLVRHFRGGDLRDALAWSRDWLALPQPESRTWNEPARRQDRNEYWLTIWRECIPPAGTPAGAYLASRGLQLPPDAPIRFHPQCPRQSDKLPAMITLMTDPVTNIPTGIHRTFLTPDGSGKAAVEPAKMMLGAAGVIRLTPDEEITAGLGIAEGIETALAVMQRAHWRPVWATGSAGAIARFPVLGGIEAITIFADADDKNGAGLNAAHECARRWHDAGRDAVVRRPPKGADWFDALQDAA